MGSRVLWGLLLAWSLVGCGLFGSADRPPYERLSEEEQAVYGQALDAMEASAWTVALGRLNILIEDRPDFFRAHRDIQDVLIEQEREDEARTRYGADSSARTAQSLTLAARLEADSEKARALLNQALEIDEGYIWAHLGLAFVHQQEGDFRQAKVHLDEALSLWPDFPEALRDSGDLAYEMGETEAARDAYIAYLDIAPHDVPARLRLASWLAKSLLDYQSSEAEYREVLRRRPDSLDALMGLAGVLGLLEEADEAIELYTRVLELDESKVDAYYNLGWCHEVLKGNDREALAYYQRYLDYEFEAEDPRSPWYLLFVVPNRVDAIRARIEEAQES